MNTLLLIDDRVDFAEQFIIEAKSKTFNVTHERSFEGLKTVLPKFKDKYVSLILDIKCLLKDDQEKEDENFIASALKFLDQNCPDVPRVILTADDASFEKFKGIFSDEKHFLKTPKGLEDLFVELAECAANSEIIRIKSAYKSVFEVYDKGLLPDESTLIKVLLDGLTVQEFSKYRGVLADIRSVQESIYKAINIRNPAVIPNNMFQSNGMIKFNPLMKHLKGNLDSAYKPTSEVYQNGSIFSLASSIYWTCGEYIHDEINRKHLISDNTIKSLTFSLMELILWSSQSYSSNTNFICFFPFFSSFPISL